MTHIQDIRKDVVELEKQIAYLISKFEKKHSVIVPSINTYQQTDGVGIRRGINYIKLIVEID